MNSIWSICINADSRQQHDSSRPTAAAAAAAAAPLLFRQLLTGAQAVSETALHAV